MRFLSFINMLFCIINHYHYCLYNDYWEPCINPDSYSFLWAKYSNMIERTMISLTKWSRLFGVFNDLPLLLKKFENTKGVIRSCKSTKDRQYNSQKKKDERTNNDLQNTTQTNKDGATRTSQKPDVTLGAFTFPKSKNCFIILYMI
jgi:hypothetical protein